ncbi:phosphagen kinase [Shewanella youngdeokensis]|uniref:Phosphagen kinase n=1 Tax=Shewanella youngdeokensis TaxID=2999068 RepID=A0ABZ0JY00_9GAMM|nr:phosphagen kinase [Shewanella sp. DAU334]
MKYPEFTKQHQSLMAKHLSPELFTQLQNVVTTNGVTLDNVINSGLQNPDSDIGVYAGDTQSYQHFAPLFNPIIRQYHKFDDDTLHTTNLNPEDLNIDDPDPAEQYIVSTRIRVGRNLAQFPLGPAITQPERDEVEAQAVKALSKMSGALSGQYFALSGMSDEVKSQLINDHFLFKAGDRFFEAAGLNRDWPAGRGIYHNNDKTFLVWINEEDQLRIISMQAGGNITQVFTRLTKALAELEKHLSFSFTQHLGYISSCPTNLGTAMRASVHIKLPYLGQNRELLNKITEEHHLQIRGIHGEHSSSEGGVFDISNRRRLGITEVECVQDLYHGVLALIAQEKQLSCL